MKVWPIAPVQTSSGIASTTLSTAPTWHSRTIALILVDTAKLIINPGVIDWFKKINLKTTYLLNTLFISILYKTFIWALINYTAFKFIVYSIFKLDFRSQENRSYWLKLKLPITTV